MLRTQSRTITSAAFIAEYEHYLADFCGLAFNSRKLHIRVIRNLLAMLSFAKTLADCGINNLAAVVSLAFCYDFSDKKETEVPSEVAA
jgi:hypothetical protein